MTKEKTYCSACGAELLEEELDYLPWYMKFMGGKEFDRKTGERNIVTWKHCPNAEPFWKYFLWLGKLHTDTMTMDRN